MHYIVGLGNPGEQYEATRHNIGFALLRALAERWRLPAPHQSAKYHSQVSEGVVGGNEVMLLWPETFMNHSGTAVKAALPPATPERLILLYDEVALPRGRFKISVGGSAGGHNGVASVIESLETPDFIRVRVGIAPLHNETGEAVRPAPDRLADFVLAPIGKSEQEQYDAIVPALDEAVRMILTDGAEAAMNRFNEK